MKVIKTLSSCVGTVLIINYNFQKGNEKINFEPKTGGSTDVDFIQKICLEMTMHGIILFKDDTTQSTASDRMALYSNGTQAEYDTDIVATTYPSQNLEFKWGQNGISYTIVRRTHGGYETNGDMQVTIFIM